VTQGGDDRRSILYEEEEEASTSRPHDMEDDTSISIHHVGSLNDPATDLPADLREILQKHLENAQVNKNCIIAVVVVMLLINFFLLGKTIRF
jgi:hypothetical protein